MRLNSSSQKIKSFCLEEIHHGYVELHSVIQYINITFIKFVQIIIYNNYSLI